MRTLGIALCAAVLTSLAPASAWADKTALHVAEARTVRRDAPVEERKAAARTLAIKGFDRLQTGAYEEAIKLFLDAEKLYHAPTILLLLAEAHEKAGKLVEARGFYEAIKAEELPKSAPFEYLDAQRTAQRSMEALDKRLPRLQVVVPGAPPQKVRVTVDGVPVLAAHQGSPQNPGRHVVAIAFDGGSTVTQAVDLREGATERVVVPLASVEGGSSRTVVPAAIAFGTGALGIAVGAIAGGLALGQAGDMRDRCAAGQCADDGTASSVSRLTTASLIGLSVGGIGLGTSAALLYFNRPRSSPPAPPLQVTMGPSSLVIRGAF